MSEIDVIQTDTVFTVYYLRNMCCHSVAFFNFHLQVIITIMKKVEVKFMPLKAIKTQETKSQSYIINKHFLSNTSSET